MGFSGNVLKFDKNNNVEDFTFILSTKNYKHIGKLNNVKRDSVRYVGNLNSKNEISFEVYKILDGETEKCWDKIIDFKSVYVKELNEYFEIKVTYNDTVNEIKTITGTSLCEAELGQTNIYGTEINTETDINRTDYVETTFYNSADPKSSLLHRVLSFAPNYKINYVDSTLCDLQRSFSIDGTSVYDFLTGECAEQFNCLFAFNSVNRTINVYDLYSTCPNCGHRGAFSDYCPECGNTNIVFFGEDTEIFVNKENLTDNITFDTDTDAMKNCFKLTSGDADMDAAIMNQNPNGSAYIYTITPEQREDMSVEFLQRFDEYNTLYDSYIDEYQQLSEDIYNIQDNIDKYTIYMMPEAPDDGEESDTAISIAKQEAAKLTVDKLSPVGVSTLSSSTSVDTVDSTIKNYTRVFVNTGLVKVEILDDSTFTYKGKNSGGWNYGQWSGAFKITNYSDKEDVVITERMTVQVHDNYPDFCQQTAMKEIALNNEEGSVFDVLNIEDINEFKSALELYSKNRLISFKEAIGTAMATLMGLGEGSEKSEWYDDLYVPYLNKLEACELEIDKRTSTIKAFESQLEELQKRQSVIQKELNFKNYLGEELYLEFCSYKREQEYNNSNYISDGLSNAELMQKARDFFEVANQELYKSSHSQHSISGNLFNLLAIPEFKPLLNKFNLGNFIRVQVGKDIYRLRLIGFEFNFSDLSTIPVTFSDVTKIKNEMTDIRDIIESADSMSRSYDTVSNQANKGQNANTCIEEMIKNSLDAATMSIKNNVNEDVKIDNTGILCRANDDITGGYNPKQLRIVSNKILFTKNNWRSSELGIGEMTYTLDGKTYEDYGVITQYLISGKIVAGDIYSANYSSTTGAGCHFDLESGSFSLADSKIVYDSNDNKVTLKDVIIEWDSYNTPEITDINGLSNSLSSLNTAVSNAQISANTAQATANSAKSVADNAKTIGDNLVNVLGYDGTKITGTYIYSPVISGGTLLIGNKTGTYAEITSDGVLNCKGANVTGVINATSGNIDSITATNLTITSGKITLGNTTLSSTGTSTIGGWTIGQKAIYNGTTSLTSKDKGTFIGTEGIRQYNSDTAYIHMQNGVLTCNGASVTGTLTAGSGSRLGSGSFIGSSTTTGWKITDNKIHTVKTIAVNNEQQPFLTLSAGTDASSTYLYAPNYFQIGGALDGVGNIGANFVGKVFIGGDCNITGSCTASNLSITGGTIAISTSGDNENAFQIGRNGYAYIKRGMLGNSITFDSTTIDCGTSGDGLAMVLHANGIKNSSGKVFYITLRNPQGQNMKGLTASGWELF